MTWKVCAEKNVEPNLLVDSDLDSSEATQRVRLLPHPSMFFFTICIHYTDLLRQGGDCEYSPPSAICEIVDNSIEATKAGPREISIELNLNMTTEEHKRVKV